MIYSVNGTVDLIEPNLAVIDCGGAMPAALQRIRCQSLKSAKKQNC